MAIIPYVWWAVLGVLTLGAPVRADGELPPVRLERGDAS
jgi:hypothetical protein